MKVTDDDVLAGVLPFYHLYGQVATLLFGLTNGSSVAVMPHFNFKAFLQMVQDEDVSLVSSSFIHGGKVCIAFLAHFDANIVNVCSLLNH